MALADRLVRAAARLVRSERRAPQKYAINKTHGVKAWMVVTEICSACPVK
jgi:hypothetical protein